MVLRHDPAAVALTEFGEPLAQPLSLGTGHGHGVLRVEGHQAEVGSEVEDVLAAAIRRAEAVVIEGARARGIGCSPPCTS